MQASRSLAVLLLSTLCACASKRNSGTPDDEPTLKAVAARTGGTFHSAEDAEQLHKVFAGLPKEVRTQRQREEITWWFAALGGLFALGAVAASMRWSPYP